MERPDRNDVVMTLEELIKTIPESWAWSIEQPRNKNISKVKGKGKPKPMRYTVFVANDQMFGTKKYASAFFDANDLTEALIGALAEVNKIIAEKAA